MGVQKDVMNPCDELNNHVKRNESIFKEIIMNKLTVEFVLVNVLVVILTIFGWGGWSMYSTNISMKEKEAKDTAREQSWKPACEKIATTQEVDTFSSWEWDVTTYTLIQGDLVVSCVVAEGNKGDLLAVKVNGRFIKDSNKGFMVLNQGMRKHLIYLEEVNPAS